MAPIGYYCWLAANGINKTLTPTTIIDARGLTCPLPVLKVEKQLALLPAGTRLTVRADDPVAAIDIPLYCQNNGFHCTTTRQGRVLEFTITAITNSER